VYKLFFLFVVSSLLTNKKCFFFDEIRSRNVCLFFFIIFFIQKCVIQVGMTLNEKKKKKQKSKWKDMIRMCGRAFQRKGFKGNKNIDIINK
jgi:hypothetical protein